MTADFTDLYKHGTRLNTVAKRFLTEFKKAEENDDGDLMRIWGESFRKITVNIVEIAKCVLDIEEIVKGKSVRGYT